MLESGVMKAEFGKLECICWISGTMFVFMNINLACSYILPKCSNYLATNKNFWRFKNTFVSWIHSILLSAFTIYNIYATPEIFEDMIGVSTKFAYITISISCGYFLYDAIDIINFNKKKLSSQNIEVLLHHLIIFMIFWVPLFTNQFLGYTLAALSIEFNTVFLHLRFMAVFFNVEKSSAQYRIISIFNIISFVLFRILTLCWMTRWIVLNRAKISLGWFSLGSFGLAAMMIINIFLLQRLLKADFTKDHKLTNSNSMKENTHISDKNKMSESNNQNNKEKNHSN